MKTRIIALGNTILRDDGVGIRVGEEVRKLVKSKSLDIDIIDSAVAGYDLVEMLAGWERVVLIDAVQIPDKAVGDVVRLNPKESFVAMRLCALREPDLETIIELGVKLGHQMPESVVLIGVQAADVCTFGTDLTPEVEDAIPLAAETVLQEAGVA